MNTISGGKSVVKEFIIAFSSGIDSKLAEEDSNRMGGLSSRSPFVKALISQALNGLPKYRSAVR